MPKTSFKPLSSFCNRHFCYITLKFTIMTITTIYILLFCSCILGLIFRAAYVPLKSGSIQAYFSQIVLLAIISNLLYIGTYSESFFKDEVELIRLFNGLYFAVTALLPAMWITYSVKVMKVYKPQMVFARTAFMLPIAILVIISIASIWNGWLFYVNDDNVYHRGPLYLPYIIILAFYMISPLAITCKRVINKQFYAERSTYVSLSTFGIFALIGVTLEVFIAELPGSAMGTVLTLLVNHLETQQKQISVDTLTKLNNRKHFNMFLSNLLHNLPQDSKVFLFVLDMDKFKHINDDFGHMKGDEALIIISNVLKKICGPKGHFISRFGGDEFTVIAKYKSEHECDALAQEIGETLRADSANFICPLSVSIGYAAANELGDNIPDLFNRADKQLYKKKQSRE